MSPLPGRVKVRVELAEAASESAEELARRFAKLTATWKEGTRHCSKMGTMAAHPAFREIVAMGEKAVPLLLADLEKNGAPIPEGHRGNKSIICEAGSDTT